jgi:CRP/FNR family transcriptional regulator, cyclic AMP receptor protein
MNKLPSHGAGFLSGAGLGGTLGFYRDQQIVYSQGAPASNLFYIQRGGVRLTTRSKRHASAVTAILGVGDFFGELCLTGSPLRPSTAVALDASSIRSFKKQAMIRMLRRKNKMSILFASFMVSNIKKYKDHVAELLTSSAEQRLARTLLRLARLDTRKPHDAELPTLTHQDLAQMVGTTRPRGNALMNRFRKHGLISYNGRIEVHKALQTFLLRK